MLILDIAAAAIGLSPFESAIAKSMSSCGLIDISRWVSAFFGESEFWASARIDILFIIVSFYFKLK